MRAVLEQWEAPFVLAQPVSGSISSICQLLRISPSRQGCFAACRNLDEQLSRHAFFFIKINDNSVVYLQLQLLSDAAGCQWLTARGGESGFCGCQWNKSIWIVAFGLNELTDLNTHCLWNARDGGQMMLNGPVSWGSYHDQQVLRQNKDLSHFTLQHMLTPRLKRHIDQALLQQQLKTSGKICCVNSSNRMEAQ